MYLKSNFARVDGGVEWDENDSEVIVEEIKVTQVSADYFKTPFAIENIGAYSLEWVLQNAIRGNWVVSLMSLL